MSYHFLAIYGYDLHMFDIWNVLYCKTWPYDNNLREYWPAEKDGHDS